MPRLRILDIRGTPLTGPLPPEWYRMPKLETVHLWRTNVDPVVPTVWGMNRSLLSVQVDYLQTNMAVLQQEHVRNMLLAHNLVQTRAESRCRGGYVTHLHYCTDTEPESSVGVVPD